MTSSETRIADGCKGKIIKQIYETVDYDIVIEFEDGSKIKFQGDRHYLKMFSV